MSDPEFFSGLVRNEADREWLLKTGRSYSAPRVLLDYPKELDPRGIVRVENQGNRNSCVGHGTSSCGEICAYIDSAGTLKLQFSRWGCYIWAQEAGNMAGRDNGAMISSAVQASSQLGFCPEEIWPYPPANAKYSTKEPAEARAAAAPYKLLQHVAIHSFDQGFEFVNQGRGGLLIGVDWTNGLANNSGDVTLSDVKQRSLGGHCMFLWGWNQDGLLWLGNSHSEAWGQNGWRLVRPEVVDYWCQRGEVYGMSDLLDVTDSRPMVDFTKIV